jgi:hypothetical protein
MEKERNQYVKGFNHAYLLAKYKPELLKSILNTKSQNDYIQGLYDGKVEFEKSKVKSRSQELKNLRFRKDINKNKGLER